MSEPEPFPRRLLTLLSPRTGGRSAVTCFYRCGNACSHPAPNRSDNPYFGDVLAAQLSRRALLQSGAAAAAVVVGGGALAQRSAAAATSPAASRAAAAAARTPLTFAPIQPNTLDQVVVPNGYEEEIVIRWGEPVVAGAPEFDPYAQTAEAQAGQFGYNNDYLCLMPLDPVGGEQRALLVSNHEYTNEELMFPGWTGYGDATPEQIRVTMAAHGMSVVELRRSATSGQWTRVAPSEARQNRRLTAMTAFRLTGPAAGSDLVRTNADPAGRTVFGTLNNCAGGTTPWGTVLSGEENFNQYFVNGKDAPADEIAALDRYGLDIENPFDPESSRGWHRVDPRFDIAQEPHEPNRFGWVVELDPYDPSYTPRKRTALGRLKHEGASIALAPDGTPAAYMGDDERFEYLYKFVSSRQMRRDRSREAWRHNDSLLDHGTLYVARLVGDTEDEVDGSGDLPSDGAFDGRGRWIPLVTGDESHVPGMTAAEVLVHTRLASDKVGATKMDRPEDVEPNPVNGRIYAALTNNSERTMGHLSAANPTGVVEANPRATSLVAGDGGALVPASGNRNGQVLEITERDDDPRSTRFSWRLFLVAGSPEDPSSYFAGFDKSQVSPISCPDNVAFDRGGNLWIATDGGRLGTHDGFFAAPVAGPGARPPQAVPLRAGRRRGLRPVHQPGPADDVLRRPAPGRGRRLDLRVADQHLARRRLPAPVGRLRLAGRAGRRADRLLRSARPGPTRAVSPGRGPGRAGWSRKPQPQLWCMTAKTSGSRSRTDAGSPRPVTADAAVTASA